MVFTFLLFISSDAFSFKVVDLSVFIPLRFATLSDLLTEFS